MEQVAVDSEEVPLDEAQEVDGVVVAVVVLRIGQGGEMAIELGRLNCTWNRAGKGDSQRLF